MVAIVCIYKVDINKTDIIIAFWIIAMSSNDNASFNRVIWDVGFSILIDILIDRSEDKKVSYLVTLVRIWDARRIFL